MADLETPVSAMLKLARNARYSFLLESVEGGAVRGRYSIIGMNPDLIWKVEGRQGLRQPQGRPQSGRALRGRSGLPPLQSLRALLAESRIKLPEDAPPMAAGVFGYMGYDMVRLMEDLPRAQSGHAGPSRRRADPPHHHGDLRQRADEVTVTSPVYAEQGGIRRAPPMRGRRSGSAKSSMRWTGRSTISRCATTDIAPISPPRSNTAPEEYKAMVLKAKDYIAAGDIFQVVLSQRFETEFTPAALLALPLAAPGQPLALPLLPRFRPLLR